MTRSHSILRTLAAVTLVAAAALPAAGGDLRNIKRGEPMPTAKMATIDGAVVDTASFKGSVLVIVCLSAEQRRSELAAMESAQVKHDLGDLPVQLLYVTADVVQKPYFEKFRQEHGVGAALAFDADRAFYAKLGLIVFPTTVIVNKEGVLDSVIALHGSDYKTLLDANVRHALGQLDDKQLAEKLAAKPSEDASPKSAASAHRSLARLMREKGLPEAAKAELDKGLALDPDNREILLDLAELDLSAGDLDGADVVLQRVVTAQPDHRRAKQLQGECLFRRGKLDEAAAVLEAALPLNPNPERVHYFLGRIAEQKGDKDGAISHYREALKSAMREGEVKGAGAK